MALRDFTGVLYIICGFAISFFNMSVISCHTLVYETLLDTFHQSRTATAWVFSLSSLLVFSLSCVPSLLTKRFSFRPVIIMGGFLRFSGLLMSAFTPSLAYIYISFGIISALGVVFSWDPMLIAVTQYYKQRRGSAVAVALAGGSVAGLVMAPLVQIMFENYGYQGAMMLFAAFTLNLCVAGAIFRPLPNKPVSIGIEMTENLASERKIKANETASLQTEGQEGHESEDPGDPTSVEIKHPNNTEYYEHAKPHELKETNSNRCCGVIHNIRKAFKFLCAPSFMAFSVLQSVSMLSLVIRGTFLAGLALDRNIQLMQSAVLISISSSMDLTGKIVFGRIYDISYLRDKRSYVYAVIGFLMGVCMVCLPLTNSFPSLAVVLAIFALLGGCYNPQYTTVLGELIGTDKLPEGMSIIGVFKGAGAVCGPVLGGMLRDSTGSYDYVFYGCGALVSLSAVVFASILTFVRYRNRTLRS